MPRQSIRIRDLLIDPPLFLAPMAGLTHSALRRQIAGYGGAGLLSTEMLSARRLPTDSPRVSPWVIRTDPERPLSYQLLVASAAEVGPAIDALQKLGADAIDLNMGCPAPAVGRFGAGAKLMERPGDAREIAREARKRTRLPLSAKIRIGGDLDGERLHSFCRMLEDEGIDLLSVHARLTHESFAREPRWGHLAGVKERLTIPVVANGGIFSVRDAEACLEASGADGLMLGRGAVIRPWLFAEIARSVYGRAIASPEPDLPGSYYAFIDDLDSLYRPMYRLGRLKEFTRYFAQNYRFGHHLASRIQSSGSIEEARERAGQFFLRNAPERAEHPK